jgi:nitrogen fixation NifU-like protein
MEAGAVDSRFEELEELVKAEMRKTYTEMVIDHVMKPRNLRSIEDADGFAKVTGSCGDTIKMWLKVKNNTITDATFLTDGCGTSVASGSIVTEMAKGKSILESQKITQQDVLDALGGLPEESTHCALLAADTLKAAIRDYFAVKNEPWRKAYRQY